MREQHQKELLKRILRYSRRHYTDAYKHYALLMSSGGRSGPTLGAVAKAETWGQITQYLEGLMRDLDNEMETKIPRITPSTKLLADLGVPDTEEDA